MKLLNAFSIVLLAANIAAASCSTSKTETTTSEMTRTVTIDRKYTGVSTANGLIVNYTVGASDAKPTIAKTSGPADIVSRIKVAVNGSTLEVRTKDGRGIQNHDGTQIIVNVSGLPINDFEASSGSVLNLSTPLKTSGSFDIEVSSGAVANFAKKLVGRSLNVEVSSGSTCNIVDGDISAGVVIECSSGSACQATVKCTTLEAEASSGAVINLRGTAVKVEAEGSSGAVIGLSGLKTTGKRVLEATSGAIIQ